MSSKTHPPSITVYRDCFHLREAIFLSNSLQKLAQITIILIIDHHNVNKHEAYN